MAAAGHALPKTLRLEVVTPSGLLVRDDVDSVQVPGSEGSFGVLPGHIPMLAMLGTGEILYSKGGTSHRIVCLFGFCEVLPDRVHVMAESGERAEDIDVAEAHREVEELRALLERADSGDEEIDRWHAEQRLRHAENKIQVAGKG